MSEIISQMRAEDAVAAANTFLETERGTGIDGSFASGQVAERVANVQERAAALLQSVPHPKLAGLYVPLSKHNAASYAEAASVLPGHLVLVPSSLVERGTSVFYPAAVSEDGLKSDSIRLHVLHQPYRQQVRYGAAIVLSAAGQSETAGVGEHGRKASDGVEAEHFATLLAAGGDGAVRRAWQRGEHINHAWRQRSDDSVMSEMSKRLFGSDMPQSTISITKQQIEQGQAMLLWHEGMRDQATGKPETATRDNALVVVQGLGYQALQGHSPAGLEAVKGLLA